MRIVLEGQNKNSERLELIEFGDMFVISSYDPKGKEINREWFKHLTLAQDVLFFRLNSESAIIPSKKGISVVTTA